LQTFKVDGMTCGGCVRGVTNAIQRIDPNSKVEVDLETKTVNGESVLPSLEIIDAITNAGFEARTAH